jgi:hypothetical protein
VVPDDLSLGLFAWRLTLHSTAASRPHTADTGGMGNAAPDYVNSRRLHGSIASLRLYQSVVTMREYSQEEIT